MDSDSGVELRISGLGLTVVQLSSIDSCSYRYEIKLCFSELASAVGLCLRRILWRRQHSSCLENEASGNVSCTPGEC